MIGGPGHTEGSMFSASSQLPQILVYGFLYLDPGSGSILVQAILAILFGLGIAVRSQWSKIKSLIISRKTIELHQQDED
jgi:hypothetical protein